MLELLGESIKAPNLPATVILAIVLFYWILNLIGLFDLDMFHADVDIDHDVSINSDAPHGSFVHTIFNFGDLPIAIIFSFFALFFWAGTILCNHYTGNNSIWLGLLIFIPNIIAGFIVTRFISIPLKKIYDKLNIDEVDHVTDLSGSMCVVTIECTSEEMGQAEVNKRGDSIRINIKAYPDKSLKKGDSALLIEYFPQKGYYLAEAYENK